jgi:hypothetical protein
MKVTIEIKKTNVNQEDLYTGESYSSNSVYLNTDETGYKEYVIVINHVVRHIGYHSEVKDIFKNLKPEIMEAELTELKESENMVPESLALKMVALVINKGKFNDIN